MRWWLQKTAPKYPGSRRRSPPSFPGPESVLRFDAAGSTMPSAPLPSFSCAASRSSKSSRWILLGISRKFARWICLSFCCVRCPCWFLSGCYRLLIASHSSAVPSSVGSLAPDTPMGYPCIQYNIPPWGIFQGDNSIVGCRRPHNRWAGSTLGRPVCSPLPARPWGFVPGSKIFTQLPAAEHPFAGNPAGLFAPRSPLGLVPPSWGAKSSHYRRRFSPSWPPGGLRSLLPAPR